MRSQLVISSIATLALIPLIFAFVNCSNSGGSGGDTTAPTNTVNGSLGGLESLYVGAYHEDQTANPEDPTSGTVYLNLPANGTFSGQMFFTYVGCQSSNVGMISGTRTQTGSVDSLSGTWNGTVDGTSQKGVFAGSWMAASKAIVGQYTVAGGKQAISIPNCIDYFIAPKGTFDLAPVGTMVPASLGLTATGDGAAWTTIAGSYFIIVSILDAQAALSNSLQAVLEQNIVNGTDTQYSWSHLSLAAGRRYIAAVLILNSSGQVVGRGSSVFIK